MAVLAEEAGGSDDEIDTVDTSLDGLLGVFHVAANVGENLGLLAGVSGDSPGHWRFRCAP